MRAKVHVYSCPNCGAHLRPVLQDALVTCDYCKTVSSVDVLKEVKRTARAQASSPPPVQLFLGVGLVAALGAGVVAYLASTPSGSGNVPSVSIAKRQRPVRIPRVASKPADPLQARLEAYLHCFNTMDHRLLQSRQRYFSWAKQQPDFERHGYVYGLYTLSDPKYCLERAKPLASEGLFKELDNAASEYLAAIELIAPYLEQVDNYYQRKHYKDDDFAKAREFHKGLLKKFASYGRVRPAFLSSLDPLLDQHRDAKLKANPKARDLLLVSQAHDFIVYLDEITWREMDSLDAKSVRERARKLEQQVDKLTDRSLKHVAERFAMACLELARQLDAKRGWSDSDRRRLMSGMSASSVTGTPEAVFEAYNRMLLRAPIPMRKIVPASWRMRDTTAP